MSVLILWAFTLVSMHWIS